MPHHIVSNGIAINTHPDHINDVRIQRVWSPRINGKPIKRIGFLSEIIAKYLDSYFIVDQGDRYLWHAERAQFPSLFDGEDNGNPVAHSFNEDPLISIQIEDADTLTVQPHPRYDVAEQAAAAVYTMLKIMQNMPHPEHYEITLTGSEEYKALFYQLWQQAREDLKQHNMPEIINPVLQAPSYSFWHKESITSQYNMLDLDSRAPSAVNA